MTAERTERTLTLGLGLFAVLHLVLAALMLFAPGTFYDEIGPWPPENHHYIGDTGSWYLASGVVLAVAVRRASWRVPVLVLMLIQYVAHSANHLADIDEAVPESAGTTAFVSLLIGLVGLAGLLKLSLRRV